MSGPKVVRIVTRDELLAICDGLLARVDSALSRWERVCARNDALDDEALSAARDRRDALAALVAADRFDEFQKQAPQEEAFLRDDVRHRLEAVARRQAEERSRERRGTEAGATLRRTLVERGLDVGPDLEAGLAAGDAGALSRALAILDAQVEGTSTSRDELARALRRGDSPGSFDEWLARSGRSPSDERSSRIEARVAEIEALVGTDVTRGLRTRLDEVAGAEERRRSLMLDGLEVESGRMLDECVRTERTRLDAGLLLAECLAHGLEVELDEAALDDMRLEELEAWIATTTSALDSSREAAAAEARRRVVLEALARIGYKTTEGMTTAVPSDAGMVVRSIARPRYGVEVGPVGPTGRIQMRPVAFGVGPAEPDPARDVDAETIWCGDVSSLARILAENGDSLAIERSLAVGAVPLKRYPLPADGADRTADLPVRRERSRPH